MTPTTQGPPGPTHPGPSLTTARAPAPWGIPAKRPHLLSHAAHTAHSPCPLTLQRFKPQSLPSMAKPQSPRNIHGTAVSHGGLRGGLGRTLGGGRQGLQIVCHQRHTHRRDVFACLGELAASPRGALHPMGDLPPASCEDESPPRSPVSAQGLLRSLPGSVRGGAGTHPTHAPHRAQHLLRCHQFLIYWIQEKITTVRRGGWEREGISAWWRR